MKILTEGVKLSILGLVSKRFEEIRTRYVSPYHEKLLACNSIFCFRCDTEIRVGSEYENVYSKNTGSKYYHVSCHEALYI